MGPPVVAMIGKMVVGAVVGKVVGKITGSSLLGALAGGFVGGGFGITEAGVMSWSNPLEGMFSGATDVAGAGADCKQHALHSYQLRACLCTPDLCVTICDCFHG